MALGSITVDHDSSARRTPLVTADDAALSGEQHDALASGRGASDRDAAYAAYDEHPLDEPDEWGVLASFREAAASRERSWRRDQVGAPIGDGYRVEPQDETEVGWADEATVQMIADEPW